MSKEDRLYSVRVDRFEIDRITLTYEEYSNQTILYNIRAGIAAHHGIKTWGLRLVQLDTNYIFTTDMKTGKTSRKEKT